MKTSPLDVVNQIYDGKIPDIKPAIRNKIKSFVQPIRKLKLLADGVRLSMFFLTPWFLNDGYLIDDFTL
jgi:hypothetical protein